MMTVGVRALQQNASAVLGHAAAGEPVEVTDRGRPVAWLVPPPQSRLAGLVAAGLARPARRHLADLGPALPATGEPLSKVLAEMRDDERY
jgi:prevent-host-death family protein